MHEVTPELGIGRGALRGGNRFVDEREVSARQWAIIRRRAASRAIPETCGRDVDHLGGHHAIRGELAPGDADDTLRTFGDRMLS